MTDFPGAIDYPAHPTNYYLPENHGGVPNQPKGWVLHTPEEAADNIEVTPRYFQNPGIQASTHYYLDSDGDVYQMVPERCGAIANGVIGKPYPSWANPAKSLNWQSLNVEIEGYGHSIHQTMPRGGAQWNSLLRLIRHRAAAYGIPLDREHIIGHYQVANNRSDPGALFGWDALIEDLNLAGDEDMYHKHDAWAAFLAEKDIPGGQTQAVNTFVDFSLPANTKNMEIEFLCWRGYFVVKHGDGSDAGRVGFGVAPGNATYGVVRVAPDPNGWINLYADDPNNSVKILGAHCTAYWT